MLIDRANLMLDEFDGQYLSASEVQAWAESELMAISDAGQVPQWLHDLILEGPERFLARSHPWREPTSFQVRFSLHAIRVDLNDRASVLRFANWLSRAVIGEKPGIPCVKLGYYVDHYLDDMQNESLAVACIQEELPRLLPECHTTIEAMRWNRSMQ